MMENVCELFVLPLENTKKRETWKAWKLSDNGTNTQIHRPENDGKRVDFTTGKREWTFRKL